jgi:spermidine synthase
MRASTAATASVALALASALLAGASGLGLQALLASSAALPFGSGTGPALALAIFLSTWALGAWWSGRSATQSAQRIARFAWLLFFTAPLAAWGTIASGPIAAVLGIAAVGFLQGCFLPALAHGRTSRVVALLVAANLLGAWLGAFGIADEVVAFAGRLAAALVAGCAALAAGVLGRLALRPLAPNDVPVAPISTEPDLGVLASALVVGLGTAWMGGVEWSLVRIGSLWFGGMQDALTTVLAASLAALALGAALLPLVLPRGARGVAIGLALCALASTWILAVRTVLPDFAGERLAVRALVLCVPALAPFGALVPLVHRATAGESGARLGRLYLHEAWGAWIGIPLVQFVLTPQIGLAASVGVTCALGAVAAVAIAARAPLFAFVGGASALAAAIVLARAGPPVLHSPPLANPALTVLSFAEDRDFAVTVVDDGLIGERTLLTDGFRAAGTGRDYRYMRVLGHLPLLLHPHPERVAVLALGTGTTVGAVALHPEVRRIDVLEIERAVVAAAPFFAEHDRAALAEGLPGLLDADDGVARVVVKLGDGRKTLRDSPATYDVVTMEPLLPDSPFGVHLYTEEAYADVRRALKPRGIACQWVPPHALEPATFRVVLDAFARSFAWTGAWISGTQIALIGAEREPELDARRWPGSGVLREELDAQGYGSPTELAARWLGTPHRADSVTRRLTDRDPWIAYRTRRVGVQLLLDLPENLRYFDTDVTSRDALGPDWIAALDADGGRIARIVRRLRYARSDHAYAEAELRGASPGRGYVNDQSNAEQRLADVRRDAVEEREAAEFVEEIAFLDDLRAGVSALAADSSREAAVAALDPLTRAAQARKERGDVHAYVAAALSRMGSTAASKALDAALARCPRLAETDAGRRARDLGLAPELWQRAVASSLVSGLEPAAH